jgi:predicted nucleotidyltransferase
MLVSAAPLGSRVILFGSQATGAADSRSDIDFLVVEPEVRNRVHEMLRLADTLRPLRLAVDVLVISTSSSYPPRCLSVGEIRRTPSPIKSIAKGRSMDPQLELADMLLGKASDDLAMARRLAGDPASPDWGIGFHVQQAVEKSLKSVLSARARVSSDAQRIGTARHSGGSQRRDDDPSRLAGRADSLRCPFPI